MVADFTYLHIHLHIVEWFQVLLCSSNNSIKHQTFVCTQLNRQTVLFDSYMGPYQVLLLRVRVELGVIEMKRYSIFPKALGLEPHHQMV